MGQGLEVRKSTVWPKNQRQGQWLEGRVAQGETEEEAQADRRGACRPGHLPGSLNSGLLLSGGTQSRASVWVVW